MSGTTELQKSDQSLEPSSKRLSGKRILVTGSSRGIGAGIASWLAKEGASLIITYSTNEAKAQEVVSNLENSTQHICLPLNVADETSVEACFNKVIETGGLHGLVNNAGIEKDQLILRMKAEEFDSVIQTNLRGTFLCSRSAIKYFFKSKTPGSIVNITSVIGEMGNPGQSNYAASKAGIEGMAKALAKEVATRKIRINNIAPGFIDTDMTRKMTDDQKSKIMVGIPLGFMGSPEDIAAAAAFLLSDEARYITGHTLSVNGGLYI